MVVDTTPPAAPSITAALDNVGANQNVPGGTPTNDTTPTLSGTAEPNSVVTIFDGATSIGSVVASGAGTWSFTTPPLTGQGAHAITATATDASANPSAHSPAWTVMIDTIAPATPQISSSNDDAANLVGNVASGAPTNDSTPLMSGTAEAGSTVRMYDGASFVGSAVASGAGNWSITPTLSGDGSHSITVQATDSAGNVSLASGIWDVRLDTAGPAFNTNPNTSVNENTGAGTVIYDAGATDASGITYAITGGADAGHFSMNASTGQVTMNFLPNYERPVDSGGNNVYNYTVTATDAAGNVSSQNASLTVIDVAEAPPVPSISSSIDNTGIYSGNIASGTPTNDAAPLVSGSAASNLIITLYDGSSVIGTTNSDAAGNWSYQVTNLGGDGVHVLTATAGDTDGNVSMHSSVWNVNLDTTIPVPTVITNGLIRGPVAPGTTFADYTANEVVTYSLSGAMAPYFSIDASGTVRNTITLTDTGPSGILTVTVRDLAGNFATQNVNIKITTPVVLDLNRDGVISYSDSTSVDLNGDGRMKTTVWASKQDGVLVWDKYHDGKVHDSSQYAFSRYLQGAATDLEGLKAFDTNANGKLDKGDAVWKEMNVWQDLSGNGISDAGEVKTLEQWGIESINLTSDGVEASPAPGVHEFGKTSAQLTDGSQMVVADVGFGTSSAVSGSEIAALPFVVDLNQDGIISYGKSMIDLDGAGVKKSVAWAGKGDGVLVWDKYHDGQVHDSSQYSFGAVSGDKSGMSGLKIFDTNNDGKLDTHDVLWKDLSVWQDANGDGVSDAGEVRTLTQLGIQSISLETMATASQVAEGVRELGRGYVAMENGSTMAMSAAALSYLDPTHAVI